MTYPSGNQDPQQWGTPMGYGQPQEIPPLGPPPKSNAGWIVLASMLVLALLGGAGLLVVGAKDTVAGSAVAASGAAPVSDTVRTSTAKPTTTSKKPPKADAKLSYTEYEGPWDFKMGDVSLRADWIEGRDHDTCAPIEKDGKLTALGCRYAAELVLSAEGGALRFAQFILVMPDAATAKTAAAEIDQKALKPRAGTTIDDFATGKWKAGAQEQFVVVTLATATSAVDEPTVQKYLGYRHADILAALLFR
ncbi:hypothetical protein NN3_18060 [Nocardia neocaledoniensis NBRC 108232]|uniref:Uncharacterized protein n=1 Tax=Nocardia neocaledoniensis TaxID=236511 RepID=A0A317NNM7_9NOCA|nr:hypothetical protein [Nocardia neocaledoniensis]PWV76582.1 hypothetical protein DFR69_104696 [Nocardia neocaledoniensis]GEM30799.1 hypothetical protein NN3_18060 [Nocardia neocaledoniensis NBRC 108232]